MATRKRRAHPGQLCIPGLGMPDDALTKLERIWCVNTAEGMSVLVVAENEKEALNKYNKVKTYRPQDVGPVTVDNVHAVLAIR